MEKREKRRKKSQIRVQKPQRNRKTKERRWGGGSEEEETRSQWSLRTGPTPGIISEFLQERAHVQSPGRVPQLPQLESAVLVKHPSFLHSFIVQLSTPRAPCMILGAEITYYNNLYTLFVVLVAKLCLTFCNRMDYRPSGYSVHGSSQAKIPEWVAVYFARLSSQTRDPTQISCIACGF